MGRGSSGALTGWKAQLKRMARNGEMPKAIIGDREQQTEIFKEIDRLYEMPQTNDNIFYGDGQVQVQHRDGSGRTSRVFYPSGENASEEEKRGALKWLLYRKSQRR